MKKAPVPAWALWRDRRGALSWPRVATLAILLWPLALAAFDGARGALGGRPLNELIHRSGWWALVFLLASLAITPLRYAGRYGQLVDLRRMIGVAACCYAVLHLSLYVGDQGLDLVRVATEIVSRIYLLVGFVALVGLVILAATSTDSAMKRMGGRNWRRLHQGAYAITLLALVHFFQQTKADVTVPILYAGLFAWLMGYRILARGRREATLTAPWLAGLSVVVAALVFVGEALGLAFSFGLPLGNFLPQYAGTLFDTSLGLRPGWILLIAGLAVAALDLVRGWLTTRRAAGRAVQGGA